MIIFLTKPYWLLSRLIHLKIPDFQLFNRKEKEDGEERERERKALIKTLHYTLFNQVMVSIAVIKKEKKQQ